MTDDLTPERIAEYPLRHAMRGYHVEQVDGLLDQVADRLERLEAQLQDSRRALADAEHRVEDATATEATLKRTLITAQRAAEDTVAEAEARATRLVADAEEEADRLLGEARHRAEQSDAEAAERIRAAEEEADRLLTTARARVYELRRIADDFESAMRAHLDEHLRRLADLPASPELSEPPSSPGLHASIPAERTGSDAAGAHDPGVWSELFGDRPTGGGVADFHD